jgi:glucose/arabinose dehydrogenase
MVIVDPSGRLLVSENGKGITQHTLGSDGCITSSKTIIAQANLNHGVAVSPDGRYLYASSMTTAWRWDYNSNAGTATNSIVVIKNISTASHSTRTLVIPKNRGNLLVVSVGSDGNLDIASQHMGTQRAVVKVFDMNNTPSGGHTFLTGGWQAGYGLRNEVGLVFDNDNNLWGVENSADNVNRIVNGQTTDIHIDNPAEELNFLGDVSVPNTKWYGYPVCFTVWDPSVIRDKTFQVGEQFMIQPNSSFNDATCAQRSTPPRLSFQAHSAPLDASFDNTNTNLYVSFHGSWNRPTPTGFKLVAVRFQRGSNGQLEPVAPANSGNGYIDIWWNTDSSRCSKCICNLSK